MADESLRRTVRMSDALYDALTELAKEGLPPDHQLTNVAELVRIAVEDLLRGCGRWDERYRVGEPAYQARPASPRAAR